METPKLTEKQQKIMTIAKWGIGLVACAIVAPVAYLAITGLVGILIAAGIGLIGINAAPVVALKLANMKDRAIDAERVENIKQVVTAASVNPIETLIQQSFEKRQASDQFKLAITAFATEVSNFANQVKVFEKEYPDDAQRFRDQLAAMIKLLDFRKDRYKQLQIELDNFDAAIKRAEAMWKMSQAAQKMNKLAGMEVADPFVKIKADAAIDSVMSSVSKAFAEMETALLDNKELQQANSKQALTNQPSDVIEFESAPVRETVSR